MSLLLKNFGSFLLALTCLVVGCSGNGEANPFYNPDFVSPEKEEEDGGDDQGEEVVYGKLFEMNADSVYEKYQNSPHVAYYSASWCGWCTKQTPVMEQLAKANPKILFVKVNADTCREAVRRNNVKGLPTILVKGVRFTGFTDANRLQAEINLQFKN